jgi:O-antigen/teichoic acid export membrane protein
MKGARTTGVYTIAYYIGIVVSIPIRNLKQIARPIVADLISQNDKEGLGKIYRDASINMILLGSLIFQIIWFNIDTVFEIMPNGDLFSEGKSIVFIISMAYLIQVSLGVGEMILSFSRYYVYGLLYSFLSIVVAIISNKLLIPNYGMQGAALGTLITCFISIGVIVGVNYLKGQLFPFDRRSIYAILLMVVFLLLDLLLSFGPQMLVVNGLKSVVFLAAFMFIAYRLELSTQLNSFSRKVFLRLGIKLGEKE